MDLHSLKETAITSLVFWIIGVCAGVLMWAMVGTHAFPSATSSWQAVFLANNQVYFGSLQNEDANYVTLSNVYYLRTAEDLQKSGESLNLVKLGGELHGPEDTIYIPKSSILFWENMKDTSRVVQTIQNTRR